MSRITTLTWLVAVAGMAAGLSAYTVGGTEYPAQKDRQSTTDAVSGAIPTQDEGPVVMIQPRPSLDREGDQVSDDKRMTAFQQEPLYRPPQRGAPGGRVGGGTRGPSTGLPVLWALVPDHVGLSSEAQPQLVWFLSEPTSYQLEFTLIDERGVTPLIEKPLSSPTEPGIQIIRLADYDVTLEKGKTYQWFVSLISDPEHRSADLIAGGMIEVGDVPPLLGEEVRKANPVDATRIWARAGFWYDAMGVVSANIQSNPSNTELHNLRGLLLEEVDLDTPAQVDRQHGL